MGRSSAILRQTNRAGARAECGIAAVIRATQVSPLRCGMLVRDIAAGHPGGRTGRMRHCGGRCATMPVGAPLVTPGAGTAQGVRGIARGGARSVAGQSRYCDKPSARVHGLNAALRRSSGRHKCRPYVAGCSSAILRQAVAVNGRRFRRRGRSLQTHDSSRNDRCRPALRVSRPAH